MTGVDPGQHGIFGFTDLDPDSYELEGYQGLNKPYTYSDMTGGAIANNTCNPAPEG